MTPDRKFKMLYAAAYEYLEPKIGKETLEQKLDHYRHHKVGNMRLFLKSGLLVGFGGLSNNENQKAWR
jgi:hypothetical protein